VYFKGEATDAYYIGGSLIDSAPGTPSRGLLYHEIHTLWDDLKMPSYVVSLVGDYVGESHKSELNGWGTFPIPPHTIFQVDVSLLWNVINMSDTEVPWGDSIEVDSTGLALTLTLGACSKFIREMIRGLHLNWLDKLLELASYDGMVPCVGRELSRIPMNGSFISAEAFLDDVSLERNADYRGVHANHRFLADGAGAYGSSIFQFENGESHHPLDDMVVSGRKLKSFERLCFVTLYRKRIDISRFRALEDWCYMTGGSVHMHTGLLGIGSWTDTTARAKSEVTRRIEATSAPYVSIEDDKSHRYRAGDDLADEAYTNGMTLQPPILRYVSRESDGWIDAAPLRADFSKVVSSKAAMRLIPGYFKLAMTRDFLIQRPPPSARQAASNLAALGVAARSGGAQELVAYDFALELARERGDRARSFFSPQSGVLVRLVELHLRFTRRAFLGHDMVGPASAGRREIAPSGHLFDFYMLADAVLSTLRGNVPGWFRERLDEPETGRLDWSRVDTNGYPMLDTLRRALYALVEYFWCTFAFPVIVTAPYSADNRVRVSTSIELNAGGGRVSVVTNKHHKRAAQVPGFVVLKAEFASAVANGTTFPSHSGLQGSEVLHFLNKHGSGTDPRMTPYGYHTRDENDRTLTSVAHIIGKESFHRITSFLRAGSLSCSSREKRAVLDDQYTALGSIYGEIDTANARFLAPVPDIDID